MTRLSPRSLRVAREVAATLFDPGDGIPSERLDFLMQDFANHAELAGARTCTGLTLLFLLVQLLPLLVIGRPRRFTGLGGADRRRYLQKLECSRLFAPLFMAVKVSLALLYFEHPDVLRDAGIHAGCLHPEAP